MGFERRALEPSPHGALTDGLPQVAPGAGSLGEGTQRPMRPGGGRLGEWVTGEGQKLMLLFRGKTLPAGLEGGRRGAPRGARDRSARPSGGPTCDRLRRLARWPRHFGPRRGEQHGSGPGSHPQSSVTSAKPPLERGALAAGQPHRGRASSVFHGPQGLSPPHHPGVEFLGHCTTGDHPSTIGPCAEPVPPRHPSGPARDQPASASARAAASMRSILTSGTSSHAAAVKPAEISTRGVNPSQS
jgi:hypothetical protein